MRQGGGDGQFAGGGEWRGDPDEREDGGRYPSAVMSEAYPGVPRGEESTPRESGVAIVARRERGRLEVLVGLRSRRSRFLARHWAFLGGALEPEDRPERPGAHLRCAMRELTEETGLALPEAGWHAAGLLVTPPCFRVRYRSEFFLTIAPEGTPAPKPPRPEEIEELAFVEPGELLGRWERGELLLPPILPPQLRALAERPELDGEALASRLVRVNAEQEEAPKGEFAHGVHMLPLRSPTLPPATHTNVWMPGGSRFVVIDPGAEDGEHARLAAAVSRRVEGGATLSGVLLTHHHRDHVEGADAFAAALGVPLLAHPESLARLPQGDAERRAIEEGETLELGGRTLVARHTPGHAPGHLAFELTGSGVLFAGDLVSGVSTIVIDARDGGDMDAYLASLRRVVEGGHRRLFPAHGPPLPGRAALRLLEHREERTRRVEAALEPDPTALSDVARRAYADTPRAPLPLAEVQALAHLVALERQGRARQHGSSWSRGAR